MHVLSESGAMKCVQCGRTDSDHTDKHSQCTCYPWFVYTCAVCFATVLIGLACCVYCTYMLVSINKTVASCVGTVQEERLTKKGRTFEEDSLLQEEELRDITSDQTEKSNTVEMSLAHTSKIRRKRKDQEEKKTKNKKRRGKGEKGKKKQKVQAAHYFLRKGLSNTGQRGGAIKPTLDIFQLATFIKAKSNPFIAGDGKFYAKKKGLYLVYAQVLFEDSRVSKVMKVGQIRRDGDTETIIQEHYCFVGAPQTESSYNNTCNVVALFFLEANDYLSVMNHYADVHISFTSNSTFFGAVYLR